jgi:hypothetical protein
MTQTIKYRFDCFKNDNLGAIPTLSKSIRGMHYGRQKITSIFNKLVPKDEYAQDEKYQILRWLWSVNNEDKSSKQPL